jgi:transcriptional regulator with XRE-family HTH domain
MPAIQARLLSVSDSKEVPMPQGLGSEDDMARRIKYEREQRAWSPAGLAAKMTKAGCPMNQSAIWKIENGTPRRKITVDEALCFADVFETPLSDLLMPLNLVADRTAIRLLEAYERTVRMANKANAAKFTAQAALLRHLQNHPASAGAVLEKAKRDDWRHLGMVMHAASDIKKRGGRAAETPLRTLEEMLERHTEAGD